jgi:hypothetical protein
MSRDLDRSLDREADRRLYEYLEQFDPHCSECGRIRCRCQCEEFIPKAEEDDEMP